MTLFIYNIKACILWRNTKLDTSFQTNTTITFKGQTMDRQKWFGFGIGKTDNYINATFYVFQLPNKILKIHDTNSTTVEISKNFFFDDSDWVSFDNVMQFKFVLNQEDFKNQTYLFFIHETLEIPKNLKMISTTTIEVASKKFQILTEGFLYIKFTKIYF